MAQTIALQGRAPDATQRFQQGRQNRLKSDLTQFELEQSREMAPIQQQNALLEGAASKAAARESLASAAQTKRENQREQLKQNYKRLLSLSQQLKDVPREQRIRFKDRFKKLVESVGGDPSRVDDDDALTDQDLRATEVLAQSALGQRESQVVRGSDVEGAPEDAVFERTPEGNLETLVEGTGQQGDARTALLETEEGTRTVPVIEQQGGQLVTQDGQRIDPQQFRGFVGEVERTEKGEPGDFVGKDVPKAVQDIQSSATKAATGLQTAQDIAQIVEQNPQALGNQGTLANVANETVQTVVGLAPLLGVSQDKVRELQSPDQFDAAFREAGIDNARLKSAVNNLAVAKVAATQDRVSNTDVANAIEEIGADLSDPEAVRQTLQGFGKRLARNVRNKVRTRPDLAEDERAQRAADVVQQELNKLTEILSGDQGQEQDLESKSTEELLQMAQ